ncbi:MAG: EamA family transporter [Syntrophobacteraceae bacterium]
MKTALVITLAVFAQAIGNTLLSKGMKTVGSMPAFSEGFSPMLLVYAMQNPFIWAGTILLIVFFACFLSALSWADLSFVLPATASGYILNVFFGSHFLGEPVSQARWFGSVLIFAGIALVAFSGRPRAKAETGRESCEVEKEMGC